MHFKPSSPQSWFNLPRKEGVAYAAQESWVQNETIRVYGINSSVVTRLTDVQNNILFGAPYDEERYKKGEPSFAISHLLLNHGAVIYQCCLSRDLELFNAGDETEVGEKVSSQEVHLLYMSDDRC